MAPRDAGSRGFRLPWRSRRRIREEVAEEIAFHVQMRVEELVSRGLAPDDAWRRAQEEFGNLEEAKRSLEYLDARRERRLRWTDRAGDALLDIRIAARSLARSPGHTAAAVITLALGIGATAAIFSLVHAVLLRPLPYPEPDRLVQVWETSPTSDSRSVAPANYLDWREQSRDFESIATYYVVSGNLTAREEPERVALARVSGNFFETMGIAPTIGRAFASSEAGDAAAGEAVLSEALWRRMYGSDPEIPGRAISLDGELLVVRGVMPASFGFPGDVELWTRAEHDVPRPGGIPGDIDVPTLRDAWYLRAIGRLAPGRTLEEAQSGMNFIARRLSEEHPISNENAGVRLQPLRDALTVDARQTVIVLFGSVLLVLLIGCANVAHLVLLRAIEQGRELVVRAALGAGRMRLVRHLFTESMLLALVGGGLGVAMAYAIVASLRALAPGTQLPAGEASIDGAVLIFAVAISVVSAVVFGAFPALFASRVDLRAWLGTRGRSSGRGGSRARGLLLVGQVTLAMALVSTALLTVQSLWRLQAVDSGYEQRNLTTAQISLPISGSMDRGTLFATYQRVVEEVGALPGVEAAAVGVAGPADTGPGAGIRIEGRENPEGSLPGARWQVVSSDYFHAAGIPLRAGRRFEPTDGVESLPVAVINESLAAQHWPNENPIGRRLNTGLDGSGVWVTVVGVVGDTRNEGLALDPEPEIYRPLTQPARYGGEQMMLLVRSSLPPATLVPSLRNTVATAVPGAPVFDVRSGDELVAASTTQPRSLLLLLGSFAVLAVILGTVGVYGVTAYGVRQRRHEIAVRLALGAPQNRIFRLLMAAEMKRVVIGLLAGLVLSVLAGRAVQGVLYGVSAVEPVALAMVALLHLLIAGVAVAAPAHAAAVGEAGEVLRAD